MRLVNQGKEFHHVWPGRLEDGKTVEDARNALKAHGPLPGWIRDMGGPNAPMPMGGETNATMVLTPGIYPLACMVPSSDGVPHLMKGMVRSLVDREAGRAACGNRAGRGEPAGDRRRFVGKPHLAHGMMQEIEVGEAVAAQ